MRKWLVRNLSLRKLSEEVITGEKTSEETVS